MICVCVLVVLLAGVGWAASATRPACGCNAARRHVTRIACA
jgi:hypothetical protein